MAYYKAHGYAVHIDDVLLASIFSYHLMHNIGGSIPTAADLPSDAIPIRHIISTGPMVLYVGLVHTLCNSNIDHHRLFQLDYSPVAPPNLSARALFELDYSPVFLDNCKSGINM